LSLDYLTNKDVDALRMRVMRHEGP